MEDTNPCHITWEEEHAEIANALIRELDVPEREAMRVASQIQNDLNQIILDRLMGA